MKIKANANISWEFEVGDSEDGFKVGLERLQQLLPPEFSIKISKIIKSKPKNQNQYTLGIFSPEEVLPYITNTQDKREFKVGEQIYLVKMNSHRYFVFKNSLECVACGLKGNKFLLEKNSHDAHPHFNLYGEENNKLILMTRDHILAKANGGEDKLSNYQTLCSLCNNLKGHTPMTIENIADLRKLYNESIKKKSSKKSIATTIAEFKKNIHKKIEVPTNKKGIILTADVNILKVDNRFIAVSAYNPDINGEHVACMKAGVRLDKIEKNNKDIIFSYEGIDVYIPIGLTTYKKIEKKVVKDKIEE